MEEEDPGCVDTASVIVEVIRPSAIVETGVRPFRLFTCDNGLFLLETDCMIAKANVSDLTWRGVKELPVPGKTDRLWIDPGDFPGSVDVAGITLDGIEWTVRLPCQASPVGAS